LNDLNEFLTIVESRFGRSDVREVITKKMFVEGFYFKYEYLTLLLMIQKGFMTQHSMMEFFIKKYGLGPLADLLELSRRQVGEALYYRGFFDKILENTFKK
jgi:hypothetical protein